MSQLAGSRTHENLKRAFSSEAQDSRRYRYFARQSDEEGVGLIAGLFRDIAESATGHAFGHLDFLQEVGDPATGQPMGTTVKNLSSALADDLQTTLPMYLEFAEVAREEGMDEIADWFETMARGIKAQSLRFQRALEGLTQD